MDTSKDELLELLNKLIAQSYNVEREFKDYKALYESVIEIVPQAIWVINEDSSIFYRNSKARELGVLLEHIGVSLDSKKAYLLERNFQMETSLGLETFLMQGEYLDGKKIITATNITQQKRNERLVAMGQISAHLAHEIRNPIGSISLMASALLNRVDEKNKSIIYEIQKSIFRVERQIKATLLFSRGVAATRSMQSVGRLKDEVEEIITQYSYSKEIEFISHFDDVEFEFDFDLIGIVLQNFIYNAIDAIEECEEAHGCVEIRAIMTDGALIFHISDTGKPIVDKATLFEPFVTTKLKGNGLGLTLSSQIIQAHNGEILVDECVHGRFTKTFRIICRK